MPGVPSQKGCEACTKQRKKCDQAKPACSRCTRLQLPCVGAGQQRYKFMAVEYGEPHGRSPAARARSATTDPNPLVAAIPSNEYTALARECSHRLATVDIRYDLAWTFGPFLRELPKRIGTNAALDAGLTALMSAVSDLALGYRSPETVIQYGCALKALRKCLADEVVAQSSNTLCAIYLIWVTMTLVEIENTPQCGHVVALARILATTPCRTSTDPFDQMLLLAVAGSVAFESAFNQEARLSPWVKRLLLGGDSSSRSRVNAPEDKPRPGKLLPVLIHLPDFIQWNPDLKDGIREYYVALRETCKMIHTARMEVSALINATAHESGPKSDADGDSDQPTQPGTRRHPDPPKRLRTTPSTTERLYANHQRSFAIASALSIILNSILQVYEPDNTVLQTEHRSISRDIIDLAMEGAAWYPLGGTWAPACLVYAWGATTDPATRRCYERIHQDNWTRFMPQPLSVAAAAIASSFEQLRAAATMQQPMTVPAVDFDFGFDDGEFWIDP